MNTLKIKDFTFLSEAKNSYLVKIAGESRYIPKGVCTLSEKSLYISYAYAKDMHMLTLCEPKKEKAFLTINEMVKASQNRLMIVKPLPVEAKQSAPPVKIEPSKPIELTPIKTKAREAITKVLNNGALVFTGNAKKTLSFVKLLYKEHSKAVEFAISEGNEKPKLSLQYITK